MTTDDAIDFAALVRRERAVHRVRVRRWRRDLTGCAWQTVDTDGRRTRWVESPRPRTPVSLAIFLHEVGHHVIGFDTYRRRCEEEYHAWAWAVDRMAELGVPPDGRTLARVDASMRYAVGKAVRRGMATVPPPLARFAPVAPAA